MEPTPKEIEFNFQEVPPTGLNIVQSGDGSIVKGGVIQSPNYRPAVSGWQVDSNGDAEFNSITLSGIPDVQTFTASGTWTKPSGGNIAFIQCWGGGGGGGSSPEGSGAGGGGGGSYTEKWILLSSLGATETVTIGAGG